MTSFSGMTIDTLKRRLLRKTLASRTLGKPTHPVGRQAPQVSAYWKPAVTSLVCATLFLATASAAIGGELCRAKRHAMLADSQATVDQVNHLLFQRGPGALQVLIERGRLTVAPEGAEFYLLAQDGGTPRSHIRQVQRPGSPQMLWTDAYDWDCPKPTPEPVPPRLISSSSKQ
jgi:hypothetical protein